MHARRAITHVGTAKLQVHESDQHAPGWHLSHEHAHVIVVQGSPVLNVCNKSSGSEWNESDITLILVTAIHFQLMPIY